MCHEYLWAPGLNQKIDKKTQTNKHNYNALNNINTKRKKILKKIWFKKL